MLIEPFKCNTMDLGCYFSTIAKSSSSQGFTNAASCSMFSCVTNLKKKNVFLLLCPSSPPSCTKETKEKKAPFIKEKASAELRACKANCSSVRTGCPVQSFCGRTAQKKNGGALAPGDGQWASIKDCPAAKTLWQDRSSSPASDGVWLTVLGLTDGKGGGG